MSSRGVDFRLYLVTDRHQTGGRSLLDTIRRALEGGVQAVQLREKDLAGLELFHLAEELRSLTRQYHARLLVNDRLDVALAVDADGVHLGQTSFPPGEARRLLGSEKLIGVSTHSFEEIAAAEGADFVLFGPIFFTPTKAAYGPPQGLERLREAVARTTLPLFAIGGITPDKVEEVIRTGVFGIAVISAILSAQNPRAASTTFFSRLASSSLTKWSKGSRIPP